MINVIYENEGGMNLLTILCGLAQSFTYFFCTRDAEGAAGRHPSIRGGRSAAQPVAARPAGVCPDTYKYPLPFNLTPYICSKDNTAYMYS